MGGCFPLHHLLLKACTGCTASPPKVKVMTVDGRFLRFAAPIIAKEVLMEYPSHALFLSDAVLSAGDRARALPTTASLQPGHLYFLVPQPAFISHSLSAAPMDTSATPAASSQSKRQRKVSFAATPVGDSTNRPHCEESAEAGSAAGMESLKKSAVEFLPAPSEGVLRLKMVVSKRQLRRVLKEGGDCISMVEGLLSPLLREAEEQAAKGSRSQSWRPSLQSIPESATRDERF